MRWTLFPPHARQVWIDSVLAEVDPESRSIRIIGRAGDEALTRTNIPTPLQIFGVDEETMQRTLFYPNPRGSGIPEGGGTLVVPRQNMLIRVIFQGDQNEPWKVSRTVHRFPRFPGRGFSVFELQRWTGLRDELAWQAPDGHLFFQFGILQANESWFPVPMHISHIRGVSTNNRIVANGVLYDDKGWKELPMKPFEENVVYANPEQNRYFYALPPRKSRPEEGWRITLLAGKQTQVLDVLDIRWLADGRWVACQRSRQGFNILFGDVAAESDSEALQWLSFPVQFDPHPLSRLMPLPGGGVVLRAGGFLVAIWGNPNPGISVLISDS